MMKSDMTELSGSVEGVESGPGGLLSRRSFLRATLGSAAAGALVLSGCGSSSKSSSSGSSTTGAVGSSGSATTVAKSLTSVSILLDFLPNPGDIFLPVARQFGYFSDEGLKPNFVNPPTDVNAIPIAVGEGRFDVGISESGATIFARSKNIPVLAIGGLGRRNECMYWISPNTVNSPHDLVGKTVANYNAADYRAFLVSYMRSAGLSDKQVNEVFVPFTPTTVVAGRAFAGIGLADGELVLTKELTKHPVNSLSFFPANGEEAFGIPSANSLVLLTSEGFANSHPDIVQAYVRAVARGYKKALVMSDAELSPIMNSWCSSGANATGTLAQNMAVWDANRTYGFYGSNQDPNTATYMVQPLTAYPKIANWLVSTGEATGLGNAGSVGTNQFVTPGAMNPSI